VFAVFNSLKKLETVIDQHINDKRSGERLRDGIRVCLGGAVNVGKSTLINLIGERGFSLNNHVKSSDQCQISQATSCNR
jgi:tRNA U34 5-carboxymethylaminomethyl modifying GTPase MnmE/TrmE